MKKILIAIFLLAFFVPVYSAKAAAANPLFSLSTSMSSDNNTLTYTASGTSGQDRENCGAEVPFDDATGTGYHGGFRVAVPYMMSSGTASISSVSESLSSGVLNDAVN